jgi:DNA repair exonuclease SbcCD ATPase subunit
MEREYMEARDRRAESQGKSAEIKRRIAELKVKLPRGHNLDALQNRLYDLRSDNAEAHHAMHEAVKYLALAEKAVEEAREAASRKKELTADLKRMKSEIAAHEIAVNCASDRGARLLMLEDRLARINAAASAIADDMSTWRDMRIEARLSERGDAVDFWTMQNGTEELPVELRSTGERAVRNLIWQAARREVREQDGAVVAPLMLIDEVLDRMDAANQDAVVGWLRGCGLQVLLVSHSARLSELVQERIELGAES